MNYPKDFIWGAATAAYQIEGAAQEDGRGESIWDRFSHTPGKVLNGDTGDVACDHYHRYRDDVALMAELGLKAYRFSIAWPRVLPTGTGATNPAGLDFYDRLVDELLAHNIQPFATLYHWDLPQTLQDQGGWENPASPQWFADYAGLMVTRLGDRVKNWITLNEPFVTAFVGNLFGNHAPGKQDPQAACQVAHHLLLAHGLAVPVIRSAVPDAQVGITLDINYYEPATPSEADRQAMWHMDGLAHRWFLDPVFRGCYPTDVVNLVQDALTGLDLDAVQSAAVPIDFLGINYYRRSLVAHSSSSMMGVEMLDPVDVPVTAMDWEVFPDGLRRVLERVHHDYQPAAIYVTENGAAYDDPQPTPDTEVIADPGRTAYLEGHFEAVSQAIAHGVPMKGYFVWSLLDNFEWAYGYDKRFGIVYVDFETQRRVLKQSAKYVQQVIADQV